MNCPYCGILIEEKWSFCPKCSNNLKETPVTQEQPQPEIKANYTTITSDKERTLAMNLCIAGMVLVLIGFSTGLYPLAILGGGLHRFYVGKLFSGVLYSLTGGLFGIGIIFDLIQINTGQFADNVGHPLRK